MEKKKKNSILIGLAIGLCFILFVIFGYMFALRGVFSGGEISNKLYKAALILLTLIVAVYAECIIHEFGHFVLGLLSGYKFSSFRVSNIMLIRTEAGIRLKRMSIVGTAGQCLMLPPEFNDGKFRFALYNLGGVLMNLISAVIALGIVEASTGNIVRNVCLCFFFSGLILAIMNGVPYKTPMVSNDGFNLIALNKDEDARKAFYMQMMINDKQLRGERLKDMPEEWFELPETADRTNTIILTIDVFKENRLMDLHEFDEAYELISGMLSETNAIQGIYKACLTLDKMYIEVYRNGKDADLSDLEKPEIKSIIGQMTKMPNTLRTNYAIELVKNDNKSAAAKIESEFEDICRHYPYKADIESETELVKLIKEQASEAENAIKNEI